MRKAVVLSLSAIAAWAAFIPMDSERGDRIFVSQGCVACHRLKGTGGTTASDLGRVLDRGYTPADLVSAMWNHAPTMWSTIREKGATVGDVDEQAAADLFAAFLSARFFELRGDAVRGKALFNSRSCSKCHGLTSSPVPAATSVNRWSTLSDPAGMVGAMWNHSAGMTREMASRRIAWPNLSAQDLSDLLVYLRTSVSPPEANAGFRIRETENGEKLFQSKGCVMCHRTGEPPQRLTLTSVAAAMWNHVGFLRTERPRLDENEMRQVLSYYWARRFFDVTGSASRGRRLLNSKHCNACHSGAGPGPDLTAKGGDFTAIKMLSAVWRHGPNMLAEMQKRGLAWPNFREGEMDDLIAALNEGKPGK